MVLIGVVINVVYVDHTMINDGSKWNNIARLVEIGVNRDVKHNPLENYDDVE